MKKQFKDLEIGQEFFMDDSKFYWYGQKEPLVKIPFMENYFHTTGYKRNAKLKYYEKYFFIEDDQLVEVVEEKAEMEKQA